MKLISTWVFLVLTGVCFQLKGQEISESQPTTRFAKEVYGTFRPDQQLVNGVQYVNRYKRCKGHPYFGESGLQPGSLILAGRHYMELQMKYDLVSQDLELEYFNGSGMTNRIILVSDFVEEFTIGPYLFKKIEIGDSAQRYYQVVSMPGFTCYIHWFKKLIPVSDNLNYLNECTEADRIFWLEREGIVERFRNRKQYLSFFPESSRKEIRKMMSRFQVRLNRATTEEVVRILEETAQIIGEGGPG